MRPEVKRIGLGLLCLIVGFVGFKLLTSSPKQVDADDLEAFAEASDGSTEEENGSSTIPIIPDGTANVEDESGGSVPVFPLKDAEELFAELKNRVGSTDFCEVTWSLAHTPRENQQDPKTLGRWLKIVDRVHESTRKAFAAERRILVTALVDLWHVLVDEKNRGASGTLQEIITEIADLPRHAELKSDLVNHTPVFLVDCPGLIS